MSNRTNLNIGIFIVGNTTTFGDDQIGFLGWLPILQRKTVPSGPDVSSLAQ